jgi:nucleoside-diphosphate-sugar epimerase
MNVLLIGGTGHIGRFLTPLLGENGHQVTVATRGKNKTSKFGEYDNVDFKTATYAKDDPVWFEFVAQEKAEVIIDIQGIDVPGTYKASEGDCKHYIACGSLWMFGAPRVAPTPPVTQNPCEFKGYAQRYKEMLEIQKQAVSDGRAFSAIMPPNICGPGKIPIDGKGGRDIEVHKSHMRGEPVTLPEGCNTLIGPCDAADIAKAFLLAVENRDAAAGEIFNVGSAYALTATEFIKALADIYNTEIPIEFVSYEDFYTKVLPGLGDNYHFREHMLPDISKLREKLGYESDYTPEETLQRAVKWMQDEKLL